MTQQTPFTQVVAACRRMFVVVGAFSCFTNLLMLTVPLYMLQIFDRVIGGRSEETLFYLTILAVFALAVMGMLDLLRSRILVRIGTWLDQRLSGEAFAEAIKVSFQARQSTTRPMRDLQEVRSFMSANALVQIFDLPWMPIYVFAIYLIHPMIALLALIAIAVLIGLALVNQLVTRNPMAAANEQQSKAQQETEAIVRNSEVIAAMGMTQNVVSRWQVKYNATLEMSQIANDRSRAILAIAKSFRLMIQVAVLGAGAYLVLRQEMGPGGMIAGSILLGRALAPIEGAIDSWRQASNVRAAYRRLQAFFANAAGATEATTLPDPTGNLSAEGLGFVYPGMKRPTIQGVGFELATGQAMAIVGPSGAGKSTLARLITGIYHPFSGTVRLDGVDLAKWDRGEIGRHVGYLPQDVELFDGSVAENIARMGAARSQDIVDAAKLAGIHDLLLRLPQGYDTEIGEAGSILSGGQRQRLGLARALFGYPRLIVLDEPNSNLDDEGEVALHQAIRALKESGSTIVLIAHRPSMLEQVDKILILRDGRMQTFGDRGDVLKQILRPRAVPTKQPQVQIAGGQS